MEEKIGSIKEKFANTPVEQLSSVIEIYREDLRTGVQKEIEKAYKKIEALEKEKARVDALWKYEREYASYTYICGIDEMATLALYNCISNIQKLDHETTVAEVKEIVDDAIKHAERGTIRKAFSVLTGSRYDEDDYVILREKNFNN